MIRLALAAVLLGAAAPASAMSVEAFLSKAETLKKRGALAAFSGDSKLLMEQVKQDAAAIRAERLAAEAAGKRSGHCPPEGGVKFGQKAILAAMEAVPPSERHRTSTKDALKADLARRYPCRG